jgi:hypothetical protein
LLLTALQKRKWKGEEGNEKGEMKWSKLIMVCWRSFLINEKGKEKEKERKGNQSWIWSQN